jgi:hypothetical protein
MALQTLWGSVFLGVLLVQSVFSTSASVPKI